MRILYKICPAEDWPASGTGDYLGSSVDRRDGFVHLSAADQVRETARRHFAGQDDLVLVALPAERLEGLRWEPSRDGALFPHVYGPIPFASALWVKPLPLVDG